MRAFSLRAVLLFSSFSCYVARSCNGVEIQKLNSLHTLENVQVFERGRCLLVIHRYHFIRAPMHRCHPSTLLSLSQGPLWRSRPHQPSKSNRNAFVACRSRSEEVRRATHDSVECFSVNAGLVSTHYVPWSTFLHAQEKRGWLERASEIVGGCNVKGEEAL